MVRKFRVGRVIKRLILLFFVITFLQVLLLRFINPWTSSKMLSNKVDLIFSDTKDKQIHFNWKDYNEISPYMPLAVIAAEDQKFPEHYGFDFSSIEKAMEQNKNRKNKRGASTITQQVAKNLFLWQGKSYMRKGLEAYYTLLIELLWSKQRIVEVYLNIAQMGNNTYGVEAASQIYLKKSANNLTKNNAALIAAVLPNPIKFQIKKPSAYTVKRQIWILHQMWQLGNVKFLEKL